MSSSATVHPEYTATAVHCVTCGNRFETCSTRDAIEVDICSECHPFYTGRERRETAGGRVHAFNRRAALRHS